jgi:hypothetical protein
LENGYCDTDHCPVDAEVRHRLSVSKWAMQKFDMKRLNLKKLNDVEVTERYQVKISNRFAALENLDCGDDVDINRACEGIRM